MRSWRCTVLLLAVVVSGPGLPAQQTWIVDPTGGGNFLDLQTAVVAASPGDTLIVRGNHNGATIDRSLQIVGDQPRPQLASITQWPGTNVSISGVDLQTFTLTSCLTSLEDVTAEQFDIRASQVVIVDSTFNAGYVGFGSLSRRFVDNGSHVVLDGCELHGSPGIIVQTLYCHAYYGHPALTVQNGSLVEVADSALIGAQPFAFLCLNSPGTSGLAVDSSSRVHLGQGTVSAQPGVPSVTGAGTVVYEGTQFTPTHPGATAGVVPVVTGLGAPPGGTMTATVRSAPGRPAALAASIGQRPPAAIPLGTAWIDPAAFVIVGMGVLDPLGELSYSLPIPAGIPRGLPLAWQAVVHPGAGGVLTASSPTILHVL